MQVEEHYHVPRTPVSVIAVGDGFEALFVRSILESLGAAVRLHMIGTPEDVLLTLDRSGNDPRFIVVCGHGDENGLVLGDFEAGIDGGVLVGGSLPAEAIASRARLQGAVVLSTACLTGTASFAAAFLGAGASIYIAPDDYPDGADAPLFVHLFFHSLLHRGAGVRDAFELARGHDADLSTFRLFA